MEKTEYLKIRENLSKGHVDINVLTFLYNHWIKYKKEEYKDLTFEEFKPQFTSFLKTGMNFRIMTNVIMKHYDNEFNVSYLRSKNNEVLTIF